MSRITTHVLDLAGGGPARGVAIRLARLGADGAWSPVAEGVTDDDGRASDLARSVPPGTFRLTFGTGDYFRRRDMPAFHPYVEITFALTEAGGHYHVPLLLSPFGYTTYRGS